MKSITTLILSSALVTISSACAQAQPANDYAPSSQGAQEAWAPSPQPTTGAVDSSRELRKRRYLEARSGNRAQRRQALLKRFDTNGDGVLDDAERSQLAAFREQRRQWRALRKARQFGTSAAGPSPSAPAP